ncbi:MAG: hypothetical protein U0V49_05945 [Saprospiraceae bacterium]
MLFGEASIPVEKAVFPRALWLDRLIDIPPAIKQINKVLTSGRFPHFSIISGPPGAGQLIAALHAAQFLLCGSEHKPCGECLSCYKVNGLIHPDLHFSFPLIGAGALAIDHYGPFREAVKEQAYLDLPFWQRKFDADNKQFNISKAETWSVIERMSMKPNEGDCNVMVIWMPEFLGKEGNVLLKLLEEPPGNSYLIMATEDPSAILPTVRSRAQVFQLPPVDEGVLADYLCRQFSMERDRAMEYAIISASDVATCINWASQQSVRWLDLGKMMFQKAFIGDPMGFLEWNERLIALSRDEQKQFFSFVERLLSLSLRTRHGLLTVREGVEVLEYAAKISGRMDAQTIDNMQIMITDTIYAIQRNANIRILLLDFMIKLSGLIRGV